MVVSEDVMNNNLWIPRPGDRVQAVEYSQRMMETPYHGTEGGEDLYEVEIHPGQLGTYRYGVWNWSPHYMRGYCAHRIQWDGLIGVCWENEESMWTNVQPHIEDQDAFEKEQRRRRKQEDHWKHTKPREGERIVFVRYVKKPTEYGWFGTVLAHKLYPAGITGVITKVEDIWYTRGNPANMQAHGISGQSIAAQMMTVDRSKVYLPSGYSVYSHTTIPGAPHISRYKVELETGEKTDHSFEELCEWFLPHEDYFKADDDENN